MNVPLPTISKVIGRLRSQPELLVLPALCAVVIINLVPIAPGEQPLAPILSIVSSFQRRGDPVLPFTILAVAVSFAYVFSELRTLNRFRRLLVAVAFPLAFGMTFEWIYMFLGYVHDPSSSSVLLWPAWWAVAGVDLFAGLTTFPYWRVKEGGLLAGLCVCALFGLWLGLGYPQWTDGSEIGLALNIVTKLAVAAFFLLLLRDGARNLSSTPSAQVAIAP